jgi:hypothetical protein
VHVSVPGPAPLSHRVALGPVFEMAVSSSRYPDIVYLVTLLADGTWSCQCPGYGYGARLDGLCKHVDQAQEQYEQSRTLAGILGP